MYIQYLISVLELETGNDLALQFTVISGLVQDGLAEFGNICFAGLPQHRVKPVVYIRGKTENGGEKKSSCTRLLALWSKNKERKKINKNLLNIY